MSNLPDIGALVAEQIAEERTVYPCYVVRASSIGYFDEAEGGCLRRGVYEQTHWREKKMPDAGLIEIFEEGNMQEDACRPKLMQRLKKAGLVLMSGPPKAKEWDGLSGRIDGYLEPEKGSKWDFDRAIWEFKTVEAHRFESIESIEDFRKSPFMRSYLGQGQVYMILEEVPLCCFTLKSKFAMRFKSFWMELDYTWAERLLTVRDEIKKHVAEKTEPGKVNSEACVRCPFAHICMPDLVGSGNFEILDNPRLAEVLGELEDLKETKGRYDALDREKKKLLPEGEEGICGDFLIKGKWIDRKGYTVDGKRYWSPKIEKLELKVVGKEADKEKGEEAAA
jgi:hypothetical protein